jgi:hypothetical protein
MKSGTPYDASVDTYAFGITVWELIAGQIPYPTYRGAQVSALVFNADIRPVIPANCPPAVATLMQRCWAREPKERPSMAEVRRIMESGQALFEGTDPAQFRAWVEATRGEHERIMAFASEKA